MYSFKVDDLTSSIRVCVAFVCGVLMMIFMKIESYFEQSIGTNFVSKDDLQRRALDHLNARFRWY